MRLMRLIHGWNGFSSFHGWNNYTINIVASSKIERYYRSYLLKQICFNAATFLI